MGKPYRHEIRVRQPRATVGRADIGQLLSIGTLLYPGLAQRCQPPAHVNACMRIGIGTRRVVYPNRRVLLASALRTGLTLRDGAHRHANVRTAALHIDLARVGKRLNRGRIDARFLAEEIVWLCAHVCIPCPWGTDAGARETGPSGYGQASLRRNYPDQVQRVYLSSPLRPAKANTPSCLGNKLKHPPSDCNRTATAERCLPGLVKALTLTAPKIPWDVRVYG